MIPFGNSCCLPLFWLTNNLFKQTNSSLSFIKEYKLIRAYQSWQKRETKNMGFGWRKTRNLARRVKVNESSVFKNVANRQT